MILNVLLEKLISCALLVFKRAKQLGSSISDQFSPHSVPNYQKHRRVDRYSPSPLKYEWGTLVPFYLKTITLQDLPEVHLNVE